MAAKIKKKDTLAKIKASEKKFVNKKRKAAAGKPKIKSITKEEIKDVEKPKETKAVQRDREIAEEVLSDDITLKLSEFYMAMALDKARNDFKTFIQLVRPDYQISGFHEKIIEYLQVMVDNENPGGTEKNPFMMFNTPPRHGKSLLCSILFPAWYLGRNPMHQIMIITYSQDYSDKHISDPIREIISSNTMFRKIFPFCTLSKTTKSKDTWKTEAGGIVNAAGLSAGLEGKGFNLLIIDDPISHDQAMSKSERETAFLKWSGSLRPRALPDAKILFQMTRWHPEDLAGRILDITGRARDGDKWRVIKFPALLDEDASLLLNRPVGEALWPQRYPLNALMAIKSGMMPAVWESEYMQRPTAIEGAIIKSENWKMFPQSRKMTPDFTVVSVDASYGNSKESDFSGIVTLSIFTDYDDMKKVLVRNVVKRRLPIQGLREEVCDLYYEYRPDVVLIEPKAAGLSLAQLLRDTGLPVNTFDASRMGNKEYRVQMTTPYYESGKVYALDDDSAVSELITDCQGFPKIQHDDTVDALTQALLYLRGNRLLDSNMDNYIDDDDEGYKRYTPSRKLHPYSIF